MLINPKKEKIIQCRPHVIKINWRGKQATIPIRAGVDVWIGCVKCGVRSVYFHHVTFPVDPYYLSRIFVDAEDGCVLYDEEKQSDMIEHPITYFRWLHQFHTPIGGPTDITKIPDFIGIDKKLVKEWEAMPMEWGGKILTRDDIDLIGLKVFQRGQYARTEKTN